MDDQVLQKSMKVCLISDPGRRGVLTGKNRTRNGVQVYQVRLDEGPSYYPEYELKIIESDTADDPWEMLAKGTFGNIRDIRRNLTNIQLSGKLANLVYSMDTTNTDFYAFQYKPVLSFMESPSKGILIADEVGLGKTIEAGLIWTELRARYDARRLLVVCPAMLREKWCMELKTRFGVNARIVDAAGLYAELRKDKSLIPDGEGLVCSMQGIRPPKKWEDGNNPYSKSGQLARLMDELAESDPAINLVIVDEAHYMRNPESQTAKLGQLLRDISDHILLLTATPINLRSDDLYHLLNLIDPDSFGVKEIFPKVLEANEPLLKAREMALDTRSSTDDIKQELLTAQCHPLLADSLQLKDLLDFGIGDNQIQKKPERIRIANRIERINLLQHAVSRTRKIEVTELRVIREASAYFVPLDPEGEERKFYNSVTNAIREYAQGTNISANFLASMPQRQMSSCMYAAATAWKEKYARFSDADSTQIYEDFGAITEENEKEIGPLIAHVCDEVLPDTAIDQLRRHDSKYETFRDVVRDYLADKPDEKIIVFSYFRPTIAYLSERLTEEGVKNKILRGGMKKPKQEIIDAFRESEDTRVLISSEVASEGVDLQFCRVLINYDLPWNPMKVEQRIGRIDRIGQKAKTISILNLLYADTIDERIYRRLLLRLGIFKRALGGLEAVLGEQISALTHNLLTEMLTPEQEEKQIEATALAIERIRQDETELENQASHLIAHGGYILEQVKAAHQFRRRVTSEDLAIYVKDYLDKYGRGYELRRLEGDDLTHDIRLPAATANALGDFIKERRLHGRTSLAAGERIRCRFINKVSDPRARVEFISQFHPFIRFIGNDLRARDESFVPLVALRLSGERVQSLRRGSYAFSMSRWSFQGLRVEEELKGRAFEVNAAIQLDSNTSLELINTAKLYGEDWLAAKREVDRSAITEGINYCEEALESEFKTITREKDNENKDRVRFQVKSAESHRSRRLASLEQVLGEHRNAGRRPLVAATQGKIDKLNQRFAIQEERLRTKENLMCSPFDVCMGVIKVY